MSQTKVITISGHAQHGKDTTANLLKSYMTSDPHYSSVLVAHFADLLKYICKTFFGWDGRKDKNGRELLQWIGTDVIRTQKPDFWVDFIADVLQCFERNWDYVLIPDARFPNEIDRLRDAGFDVIHLRVVRPGFDNGLTPEQLSHPSETALDNVVPDYTIENDGSIEDLRHKAIEWAWSVLYGKA